MFGFLAEEVIDGLPRAERLALVDSSVPADADAGASPRRWACRRASSPRRSGGGSSCAGIPPAPAPTTRSSARSCSAACSELRSEGERAEPARRRRRSAGPRGPPRRGDRALAAGGPAGRGAARARLARPRAGPDRPRGGRRWLERLPPELRSEPAYLLLRGHILWGAGRHDEALEPLRAAASGFRQAGDEGREWVGRLFLVDALFSVGAFGEIAAAVRGMGGRGGPGRRRDRRRRRLVPGDGARGAGQRGRGGVASRSGCAPTRAAPGASLAADALARVGTEPAAGRSRELLERLDAAIAGLERERSLREPPVPAVDGGARPSRHGRGRRGAGVAGSHGARGGASWGSASSRATASSSARSCSRARASSRARRSSWRARASGAAPAGAASTATRPRRRWRRCAAIPPRP